VDDEGTPGKSYSKMVDGFNPPNVWAPFGAFSMGVIQADGQIVYLKGQVALDREGQVVGKGDMRAQVRKALENIQAVLSSIGGTTRDVTTLTHYVTDIEEFMRTADIRQEYFAEPYPVTTTVQVVRLYRTELVVEITATAEIPRNRFKRPTVL
jgi:2-iminobutanoate/2-iminopropanoate deaminase